MQKNNYYRFFERISPYILGTIGVWTTYVSGYSFGLIKCMKELLGAAVNISSILVGFLATMMSVLIAIAGSRVMRRIKRNKADDLLKWYFLESITSGFLIAVTSTVFNLWVDNVEQFSRILLAAWTGTFIFFLASTAKILLVMVNVLKNVIDEEETQTQSKMEKIDATNAFKRSDG